MNKRKTIMAIGIELVLLVAIVFAVSQITPDANLTRTTGAASQEILQFRNAQAIFIDDNLQFSSPQRIDGNETTLEPGKYYWKALGLLGETKTGNFTIESEVILNVKEGSNVTQVRNAGNVPVNLSLKEGRVVTGNMVINEGEWKTINGTNKTIKGEQK